MHRRHPFASRAPLACGALLALAALACGSHDKASAPPSHEEAVARLAEAHHEVDALRQRALAAEKAENDAQAQLQEAEQALDKARESHTQLKNALRDAEMKLASLEPPPPSDEEVFRRVQKELLDAPALSKVAIQAEVAERKVTLRGVVPDAATRDAAVTIARSVEGVGDVQSEIRISN